MNDFLRNKIKPLKLASSGFAGIAEQISRLPQDLMPSYPAKQLGDNYNRLLSYANEIEPGLSALLPTPVQFTKDYNQDAITDCRYADLAVYCNQSREIIDCWIANVSEST